MEATAVSLARSVLDGVVSSAGSAVADEVAQLIGVPTEVEFIRSELEMMKSFLKTASAQPDDSVRTWVKQVRDLAYDVEDCLLEFERYAAMSRRSWRRWPWLLLLTTRHRIAAQIRNLKARVEEINQRNQRYRIVVDQSLQQLPPRGRSTVGNGGGYRPEELGFHQLHGQDQEENWSTWTNRTLLKQAQNMVNRIKNIFPPWLIPQQELSDIIGRSKDKRKITKFLSRSYATTGALAVVSVWGMGGMGKSSLVKMVLNDPNILDEFDCNAWVTVSHPLDNADEFERRLVKHLSMPPTRQDLKTYLHGKRYMIIVDDLASQEEWDLIWKVLYEFNNNMSSRIVVTTRRKDVAMHCRQSVGCGKVYELKPLGEEESMNLLCQKVYGTNQCTLSEEMAEQARHILKRCWGLPLAISTIGGLLANRPKTSMEWINLHEHVGGELEFNNLRDINRVILSSYDALPYHLKSIFLYLSIFPENQEIKYNRLLRRWMAEGYIEKNRDMPVEVVGEHLYNELINRSMMQRSGKTNRCRVHGMMLQIILSRSIDENQLFLIKKHYQEAPHGKIRHLVVDSWKNRKNKLENINLSYVRSLTVFGECPSSLISPKMLLLRVLDLEDTTNVKNEDIRHIGELHQLRYLCLKGTGVSKLPSSLQNLQYLETLDIQDTKVTRLPNGVAKLQKLKYLIAGVNFSKDLLQKVKLAQLEVGNNNNASYSSLFCNQNDKVLSMEQLGVRAPEGIEKLVNLHTLSVINVGQGNGVVEKIKKMMNLRRLGVAGITQKEGCELCKSIESLSRLHQLELCSESLDFCTTMDTEAAPKHLVSLRLYGKLPRFPRWITSLKELSKVKLLGTQMKKRQVKLLGKLPSLSLLGLWENSYIGDSLKFKAGTFMKLKFLDIDRLENIDNVRIKKGALLELERLWLNRCRSIQDNADGLRGVPHLPNLNELVLKNCGETEELVRVLQDQVSRHDKRPKFLVGKIVPTASSQAPNHEFDSTSSATSWE